MDAEVIAVDGSPLPKFAVVDCEVVGHQSYGLIIRSGSDRRGFVDHADIADLPRPAAEWPAAGDRLRGVVLGQTRDGRLRLSTRERDVLLVESLADPAEALREWQVVNRDDSAVDAFYQSPIARPLLRWALSHPPDSAERERAHRLLLAAPTGLRNEVLGTN